MAGNILGTLLLNIVAKANTTGLDKTERALKKAGKSAQSMSNSMGFLSRLSGGFFGGFNVSSIRNAFQGYLQFEKDLGAMKSRFFAITKDEKQAEEEFNYIRDVALRTANDVKSTADSYSIFYSSAQRALGKEGAREVFESWTEVGRVLHMDEQAFERVTYALREMSSKGQLYSQDLKMQLGTHVPDAVNIATTAIQNMGLKGIDTIEKFQELTKKNPKGGYMGRFLLEFSKEARSRFASPEALAKALQQPDALEKAIKNTGFIFLEQFSKRGGGKLMASILLGIQKLIEKFPMEKATEFLGKIASTIGDVLNLLIDKSDIVIAVLRDILISLAIFKVIGGIGRGLVWIKTFGGLLKGSVGARFLARFGLGALLRRAFFEAVSKIFLGTTFKTALALGLNAVPVIGQILSILMWIWTAIDVIRLLMPKKDPKNFSEYLGNLGVNPQTFYDTFKNLNTHKKDFGGMTELLQMEARSKLGKELGSKVEFRKGELVVNFNGNFLTLEDLQHEIGRAVNLSNDDISKQIFKGKYATIGNGDYKSFY